LAWRYPNSLARGAYQRAVERLGQLIEQAQRLTEAPPPSTTAHTASPP
jgi:hypothetical protein